MDEQPVRLLAFDPGSNFLGISVFEVVHSECKLKLLDTHTVDISKLSKTLFEDVEYRHGIKMSKMHTVKYVTNKMCTAWNPLYVVTEGPYLGHFPGAARAYASLVECVSNIRAGVYEYDPAITLKVIDPATVKVAVGVSGKSSDKTALTRALYNLDKSIELAAMDVSLLDEHSVDSIAVGIAWYTGSVR